MNQTGTKPPAAARVAELASRVNCITEDEFCLLAGITPGTAEAWRKRGTGPAYAMFGNRVLYPIEAVQSAVTSRIKHKRATTKRGEQ